MPAEAQLVDLLQTHDCFRIKIFPRDSRLYMMFEVTSLKGWQCWQFHLQLSVERPLKTVADPLRDSRVLLSSRLVFGL